MHRKVVFGLRNEIIIVVLSRHQNCLNDVMSRYRGDVNAIVMKMAPSCGEYCHTLENCPGYLVRKKFCAETCPVGICP